MITLLVFICLATIWSLTWRWSNKRYARMEASYIDTKVELMHVRSKMGHPVTHAEVRKMKHVTDQDIAAWLADSEPGRR